MLTWTNVFQKLKDTDFNVLVDMNSKSQVNSFVTYKSLPCQLKTRCLQNPPQILRKLIATLININSFIRWSFHLCLWNVISNYAGRKFPTGKQESNNH